jgi:hypothetical protein
MRGGPRINNPIITLNIELSSTAPADISFPIFTLGSISGWMRSNMYSIDVLIASVIQTINIAKIKNTQWIMGRFRNIANTSTRIVAVKCILELFSDLIKLPIPLKAF